MASSVRKPRAKVTANGTPIRWQRVEVVNTAFHLSDSFMVHLPLFDPQAPFDWKWWASTANVEVEILVGFEDDNGNLGGLTSLIVGLVDRVDVVPLPPGHELGAAGGSGGAAYGTRGAYLSIAGGDYSRALMSSPISQQQAGNNLTSKEVIQSIAANHPQLTLNMPDDGAAVGSPYDDTTGRLFLHRSEWDVVTAIAEHQGWKAMMQGRTLYVGPPQATDTSQPYQLTYNPSTSDHGPRSNCIGLHLARNLNIARGIKAVTESYDSTTGAPPVRSEASVGDGSTTYTQNVPGMTIDQADQSAASRAAQIASYERDIQFEIPGDPSLMVDMAVSLSGTGTAFDQTYKVAQLAHLIDMRRGYLMEGIARSVSQGDTTADSNPSTSTLLSPP